MLTGKHLTLFLVLICGCQSRAGIHKRSAFAINDIEVCDPAADCSEEKSAEPDREEIVQDNDIPDETTQKLGFTPPTATGGELFVVAHQDDDLLFLNPDILHSIRAGKQVRTIYLSAGEAGLSSTYWHSRESGVEAAYAYMAGVANSWETVPFTFSGKQIQLRYLVASPKVSLMFLRLPDGMVYGAGSAAFGNKTIEKLWKGSIPSISSVDGSNTYTKDEMIALLAKVMDDLHVDRVNSLDSSKEIFSLATYPAGDARSWYTHDNSDHVFSGHFAYEAQRKYTRSHQYRYYVGYAVEDHPENVPTLDFTSIFDTIKVYTPFDSETCGTTCTEGGLFGSWLKRKVSSVAVKGPLKGLIDVYQSKCVQPVGAVSTDGTAIEIAACNGNPEQQWQLNAQGELVGLNGKCLQISGSAVDGAAVELATCNQSDAQHWTFMSSAQLRGKNNKCLDVKDGLTADGSALQVLGCNGLAQQRMAFKPIISPVVSSKPKTLPEYEFGVDDISWDTNMANSFKMPDINGDGRADACIVRADGVYCALRYSDGSLANYSRLSTDVINTTAPYSATIMYGDLNGDGRDDLCVREAAGVSCAEINAGATAFVNFSLRTSGDDFSDADGWDSAAAQYQSIRMGDLNRDGKADICGRSVNGIVCALNNGSGMFAAATLWLNKSVAEAGEWTNDPFASSTQLADVNGDQRDDICFLANKGLYCAQANSAGTGFEKYHRAGHKDDMVTDWQNSPTYYRTVGFPDINGDSVADVCARPPGGGIACGIGMGDGYFDRLQAIIIPQEFLDGASGWDNALYAQSFQYGDINGDKHADFCARGFYALLCTFAP